MLVRYKLPLKYVIQSIWGYVLMVVLLSTFAFLLSLFYTLPPIPIGVPAFMGTAISLVLAFKLGQSYDRWWESRKIWGSIVNDSRTLVVQLQNFSKDNKELVEKIAMRQIAWCYSLGQSLRRLDPLGNIDNLVSGDEIESYKRHSNVPLALMNQHAEDIALLHKLKHLNDYQHIQIDKTLVRLVESMGMAERIKSTTFPITYRMYIHFFIYVFLGLLSISLVEIEGAWQILFLTLISLPFLLLERTAYVLQDPFENRPTDTAVTSIARTIDINIRQLLNKKEIPPPIEPEGYYIM